MLVAKLLKARTKSDINSDDKWDFKDVINIVNARLQVFIKLTFRMLVIMLVKSDQK